MAKQIIWSLRALSDRKEILDYWRKRNKSVDYSKKLNLYLKEAVRLISDHPEIGKPTNHKNIRIKIVRDYFVIYEDTEEQIQILTIWDSRQDPEKSGI